MMVSKEVTELTHTSVIIKWVKRESLERLEGLSENLIRMLAINVNAASKKSSRYKKISGRDRKISPWC